MSPGPYFLGVDGGGTKTEAMLVDQHGSLLGYGLGGPTNTNFVPLDAARQALVQAVDQACRGYTRLGVARAALCVPALGQQASLEQLAGWVNVPVECLQVSGDVQNAYAAALANQPGVVVLAGTGSFASGKNLAGQTLTVGGWGPALGDEGSGYAIGLAAIKAAILAAEGRLQATRLAGSVLDHFHLDHIEKLRSSFYRLPHVQQQVAALVPRVVDAAGAGDSAAKQVLWQAGNDLAALAGVVIRRLDLDHSEYTLALSGGVRRAGAWILDPFEKSVRSQYSEIQIRPPRLTPSAGSILIAMEGAGVPCSRQILTNLERGSSLLSRR